MTDEKKQELFPFFALIFSQQLNPEKYGAVETYEEWSKLLEESPKDVTAITEAATKLTDDQWSSIEKDYDAEQAEEKPQEPVTLAKEGAKIKTLQKLQTYKKGKSMAKKCSCGCAMVSKKSKGGKVVSKCSCGCKASK